MKKWIKMVKIIIVGFGNVGRSLIKILHNQKEELLQKYNFSPQVVAISELKGALINSEGLSIEELANLGDISTLLNPDVVQAIIEGSLIK